MRNVRTLCFTGCAGLLSLCLAAETDPRPVWEFQSEPAPAAFDVHRNPTPLQNRPRGALAAAVPDRYAENEGTLILEMRLPDAFSLEDSGQAFLFAELGPEEKRRFSLQFWEQGLRLNFGPERGEWGQLTSASNWQGGTWQTVGVTWRQRAGITLWLNGFPVHPLTNVGFGKQSYIWRDWMPGMPPETLVIGARDETGRQPWRGTLRRIRIYDRVLTAEEMKARAGSSASPLPEILFRSADLSLSRPGFQETALRIGGRGTVTGSLAWELRDAEGTVRDAGERELRLSPAAPEMLRIPLPALTDPRHQLDLHWRAADGQRTSASLRLAVPPVPPSNLSSERRPVFAWSAHSPQDVPHRGELRRVETEAGAFLEADAPIFSRFHVPFEVEHPDRRHVAVFRIPDDKNRTMEILLLDRTGGADSQLHTGVFLGGEYPSTGGERTVEFSFYPPSAKLGFLIMTSETGAPAALAGLEVFEEPASPRGTPVLDYDGPEPGRRVGIYFEDPQISRSFGFTPEHGAEERYFYEGVDRLIETMHESGSNLLLYPSAWYYGPLYGSWAEPLRGIQNRPHPLDFPRYLLDALSSVDAAWIAGWHLHSLQSLRQAGERDPEAIHQGRETPHNVMADGRILIDDIMNHLLPSLFNPLDPMVQTALKNLMREFVGLYGDHPAWAGVHLRLAPHKMFWFGSGDSGYNDSNIRAFSRDTGIELPAFGTDRDRFAKRFQWLKDHAWEAWVQWRCERLADFYRELARILSGDGENNRKLYIDSGFFTWRYAYDPAESAQLLREAGFDPALYRNDPLIVAGPMLYPADYRYQRFNESIGRRVRPDGRIGNRADTRMNLLYPEAVSPWRELPATWVNFHERYFETRTGQTHPLPPAADGEAGDVRWRISQLSAINKHGLEAQVYALANLDVLTLGRGGIRPGFLGFETHAREFARGFRALPAVRMRPHGDLRGPAVLRVHHTEQTKLFYVLNLLPFPVTADFVFEPDAVLTDATTGNPVGFTNGEPLELPAYGLRVFRGALPLRARVEPGPEARNYFEAVMTALADSPDPSEPVLSGLNRAVSLYEQEQWAELYLHLQGSWRWRMLGFDRP